MSSKQSSERLQHYFSRLSPDVFCHPVWVNFAESNVCFSPNLVRDLLHVAGKLEKQHKPMTSCQIRFICAVLQNRSGDYAKALTSIDTARSLAERYDLPQVSRWAAWGASSFCARQGHYRQAAEHLDRLQAELSERNEWILSNIVATVRQILLDCTHASLCSAQVPPSPPPGSTLGIALDWLLGWGEPPEAIKARHHKVGGKGIRRHHPPAMVSVVRVLAQGWCLFQRAAKRAIKDGLRSKRTQGAGHPASATQPNLRNPPGSATPTTQSYEMESHALSSFSSSDPSSKPGLQPSSDALSSWPTREPLLVVYCLGSFRVYVNERLLEKWPGNKCKCIFKYMIVHRERPIHREILMDLFWRDVDPVAARRNLYQAIYSLRQALQEGDPDFPHILLEDSCYRLNPALNLWVDSETFDRHYQNGLGLEREGRLPEAIAEYELAENLYGGEFLAEDIYEDWPLVHRENLKHAYLDVLDRLSQFCFDEGQLASCITYCQKILAEDNCREDAHRRLMRIYSRQGQRHLALRQYHTCIEALERELDVPPMPTTVELYRCIQEDRLNLRSPKN